LQLGCRPSRHCLDQVVAELAACDRADLRDFFGDRPESIQTRDQRGMQGGRDRSGRRWAGRQYRGNPVFALAAFENRLG